MLLTITCTAAPATDLGFLLHKNPDKMHSFAVSSGQAQVFYPEAGPSRCTAALLLEVDPVALVRGRRSGGPVGFSLTQYVNDRPYAASSLLAVALSRVFRTAMTGAATRGPSWPRRRCRWRSISRRCRAGAGRRWPLGFLPRSAGRSRQWRCPWTRSCPSGVNPTFSTCACTVRSVWPTR